MDKEDKAFLKKILTGIGVGIVIFSLLLWGLISCIDATCVKGNLGQCCSQSFPCQQK